MSQVNGSTPGVPPSEQAECPECENAKLIRALAERLEGSGLKTRLDYSGGSHYVEHADEIMVTNPAAPERGEIRIADDGGFMWEYCGSLDDSGIGKILVEVTSVLGAAEPRPQQRPRGVLGGTTEGDERSAPNAVGRTLKG